MRFLILLILLVQSAWADQALDKAREAAMIQTGAKDFVDRLTKYTHDEIRKRHIPLDESLFVYKVARDKSVAVHYRDFSASANQTAARAQIQFHF